jgi:hypothetical protein
MTTIKSISYIVRESKAGFCVIEAVTLSSGTLHQRGIQYGLTSASAQNSADSLQAQFNGWGFRPATI